jgi:hypothetical protein
LREVLQIELGSCQVLFDTGKIETFFPRLVLLEMENVATMPVSLSNGDGVVDSALFPLRPRRIRAA